MAIFTSLPGWSHIFRYDGIFVRVKKHGGAGLPGISYLAPDHNIKAVASHVTVFAGDDRVNGILVGNVLRGHGMTGEPAKRGGIAFFPGIIGYCKEQNDQEGNRDQGKDSKNDFGVRRGKEKALQCLKKTFHVAGAPRWQDLYFSENFITNPFLMLKSDLISHFTIALKKEGLSGKN